ncbi:EthD domain-containing protein [Candidatus Litorirhabdus singularis]|nr:EthD domain-containing protein [Candidatus Litorirhabdus singularis]
MIKLIYCISKREDLDAAEFYRYWLQDHAPLVKSVAAAIGASRYVQSHTALPEVNAIFQAGRGLEAPYDGITELWWQDQAAFEQGTATPEGVAAARQLQADEANFIDFSRSRIFMSEEHEIFDLAQ